jgi:hypothetical protein
VGAGQVSEAGEWVPSGVGQQAETGWEAAWGFEADEEMDRAHDLHIISQEYPSFDMDRCASDTKKGLSHGKSRGQAMRQFLRQLHLFCCFAGRCGSGRTK